MLKFDAVRIPFLFLWLLVAVPFAVAAPEQKPAASAPQPILVAYKVTETIVDDTCYQERQDKTRTYTWLFAKLPDRTVIFDRSAAVLNPMEHPILVFRGMLEEKEKAFSGAGEANDVLSMQYSSFGVLSSDLYVSLTFPRNQLRGSFVNKVDFKPGDLGYEGLKLWVKSYEALRKAPVKVDSVPLISTKPPCELSGRLEGTRIDPPTGPFFPEKELEFVDQMRRGEEIFVQGDFDECNKRFEKLTKLFPERPDGFWRLGRSFFMSAEHLAPEDRAGRLGRLDKAKKYSSQGISVDDMSAESWFIHTASLGRFATTKGILNAIRVTGELERGFLAAAARRPRYNFAGFCNAGDIQCGLGIYYRLVPDWWIVKVLTGSRGDINRSVYHVREALRFQPYRIEYNKELALSLLCRGMRQKKQGDLDEGLAVIRHALELPDLLRTDPVDKEHMRGLLRDFTKACAYSRDGFQDISEQSFKKIQKSDKALSAPPSPPVRSANE